MEILTIYPGSINERHIGHAAEALRDGRLVIYPTDTLYAIGCDALNQRAVRELCRLKGLNPDKNLLSIVCPDISGAAEYARIDNHAFRVLKQYLPGPFTFILPASTSLPKVFKGRKTVGIRIPDCDIACALAQALGNPLLTSSVDIASDNLDPAEPGSIALYYENDVDLVIDGGIRPTTPSTIVDLTDSTSPEIVRQGIGQFN